MSGEESNLSTLQAIRSCCEALEDKKAVDLVVLDMRGKSTITDFFILATGNSDSQLRAMRIALEGVFKTEQIELLGVEFEPRSGWLVVDGFDFMIHLFLPEQREFYNLDLLWKDASPINWKE
tara:strand:- start:3585 stop:3950 length:366 start_codon:yes stop_codon:yes gene_type:complete